MQKIATHKLQPYGTRGQSLSIPKVYVADNEIETGDDINIYRETIDGKDVLIIIPVKVEESVQENQVAVGA